MPDTSTPITPPQAAAAPSCSRCASGVPQSRVAPVDLEQIDAELDEVRAGASYNPRAAMALRAAELLRAEVDRVAALRVELAAELEDLQAVHAKTCSNFEEFAEGALETQQQLRAALAGARAELGRVRARAGWSGALAAHLRFLVQAVEQWRSRREAGHQGLDEALAVERAARQARAALTTLDRQPPPVRVGETGPEVRRIRCMPPGHTCPGPFGHCGACPDRPAELRTHEEVQAQTLYAGLPNLPTEPAVADDEQVQHWNEHNDHTEGADHG